MDAEKTADTHAPALRKVESAQAGRCEAIGKTMEAVLRACDDLPNSTASMATFLVTKSLSDEWHAALHARSEKLSVSSMSSDIDGVIDLLNKLKIGLSLEPGAEEKMRKALSLATQQFPKTRAG